MRPFDIALLVCVTLIILVYMHETGTRYQHLPGAAFDRWTGRVVHPGEAAPTAQP